MSASVALLRMWHPQQSPGVLKTLNYLDILPFFGTVKNIIDLFLKYCWKPKNPENLALEARTYYVHVQTKTLANTICLLIPFLGAVLNCFIFLPRRFDYYSMLSQLKVGNIEMTRKMYAGSAEEKELVLEGALMAAGDVLDSLNGLANLVHIYQEGTQEHKARALKGMLDSLQGNDVYNLFIKSEWLLSNAEIPEINSAIIKLCRVDITDYGLAELLANNLGKLNLDQREEFISFCLEDAIQGNERAFERITQWIHSSSLSKNEHDRLCDWMLQHKEQLDSSNYNRLNNPYFKETQRKWRERFNAIKCIDIDNYLGEIALDLGVSSEDIDTYDKFKKVWSKWVLKNHPDKVSEEQRAEATERFKKVDELRKELIKLWEGERA